MAERFAIEPSKSLYLTKYIEDTPCEHQYVLVYVISRYSGDLTPNPRLVEQMKWWTQPQTTLKIYIIVVFSVDISAHLSSY